MSAVHFESSFHMVTHARLMSSMRTPSIGPPVFYYGTICHWLDVVNHTGNCSSSQSSCVKQLVCRALIQVIRLKQCAGTSDRKIGNDHTIEQDATNHCREFIADQYRLFEKNTFVGTFVDGLDIFAAGVLVTCMSSCLWPEECTSNLKTVHKCTSLLASVGRRFSSFNMLPKVLWALFDASLHGHLQDSVRSTDSKLCR